ncbi:MAG: hypothetical protein ACYC2T_05445 [Bacillota bacterium]
MSTGHLNLPHRETPGVSHLKCRRCGLEVDSTATRCPRCFQLIYDGQCRGSCKSCAQHSNECREGK